jgi:4-hydroxy-tetrahydrodipicolinate reductase
MNKGLKIAIIGYGAMGKEIEKAAQKKGMIISEIFDVSDPINSNKKYDFDVAIDFSYPDSVFENVKILSELGKNIVLGTTGWYDNKSQISEQIIATNVGLIYDSNFSIGMNLFHKIVAYTAKLINAFPEYDILLNEIHHRRKKDHPSGTAITLAELILQNMDRKTHTLEILDDNPISNSALQIGSMRIGDVAGTHSVLIDSQADTIELTHRAKNREGLALGAISAATWINNKRGFYKFSDVFEEIIG